MPDSLSDKRDSLTVYSFVLKVGDVFEQLSPNGEKVMLTRTVRACDGKTVYFKEGIPPLGTTLDILQDSRWWRRASA